jgi:hypothetical protein
MRNSDPARSEFAQVGPSAGIGSALRKMPTADARLTWSGDIALDGTYELFVFAGIIDRLPRKHSPVSDQLRLDRLSIDFDLDATLVADLDQPPSDLVCTSVHCFAGGLPDILVEPPISNETDHNMCRVVAILFI